MIFNFGSISDLYNRIKLLNTRVANTEAVDVAQNNRMTNIESVNTAQNTRMTNIENRLISSTKELSNYVTMYSGFTLGNGSFIRMYGNVVDMVLIVNGSNDNSPQAIGKLNSNILPYSSNLNREFFLLIGTEFIYPFIIDNTNGEIITYITSRSRPNSITLRMTYIV